MVDTLYAIATLAAFLLGGAGTYLIVSRRERKQGWLMLMVAVVLLLNVLIWTLPIAP